MHFKHHFPIMYQQIHQFISKELLGWTEEGAQVHERGLVDGSRADAPFPPFPPFLSPFFSFSLLFVWKNTHLYFYILFFVEQGTAFWEIPLGRAVAFPCRRASPSSRTKDRPFSSSTSYRVKLFSVHYILLFSCVSAPLCVSLSFLSTLFAVFVSWQVSLTSSSLPHFRFFVHFLTLFLVSTWLAAKYFVDMPVVLAYYGLSDFVGADVLSLPLSPLL